MGLIREASGEAKGRTQACMGGDLTDLSRRAWPQPPHSHSRFTLHRHQAYTRRFYPARARINIDGDAVDAQIVVDDGVGIIV